MRPQAKPGRRDHPAHLVSIHRKVVGVDLDQSTLEASSGQLQLRRLPGDEHQLGSGWKVSQEFLDHLERAIGGCQVCIIEHDRHRRPCGHGPAERREQRRVQRTPRPHQNPNHLIVQRRAGVNRCGDVSEEIHRVAVGRAELSPGKRPWIRLRPQLHSDRLPAPRRCSKDDQGRLDRLHQSVGQYRALHDPGPEGPSSHARRLDTEFGQDRGKVGLTRRRLFHEFTLATTLLRRAPTRPDRRR